MARLLVVDDEPNVRYAIKKGLECNALEVALAETGRQGLDLALQLRPDVVIVDVRLTDTSGLDLFDRLREIDPRLPVIIITAYAATETAIHAMKRGAFEFLLKPVDFHQLREVVQRALEMRRLYQTPSVFGEEGPDEDAERIVGRSPAMQELYKAIGRVAPRDVTVFILGESGTGKELVARALFHHSARTVAPFLAINCAAIPETLLESELFGHERGAFTGAENMRQGKFELVSGGTLFLDEIGDMSAATQTKVLRLIQEQRFERLGGSDTIQTDVRLIAASNKDLEAEAIAGRFRSDLFYRLNVFTIRVPPLRERRGDIPLLVDYFLPRFGRALGREVRSVASEVMQCLRANDWPGNVRQLQSVLKYAIVQGAGEVVTLENLPDNLRTSPAPSPPRPSLAEVGVTGFADFTNELLRAGEPDIYYRASLEMDRIVLMQVLRHVKGNQMKAAELLGISRTTLRMKLRTLRLEGDKPWLSDTGLSEG